MEIFAEILSDTSFEKDTIKNQAILYQIINFANFKGRDFFETKFKMFKWPFLKYVTRYQYKNREVILQIN